MGGTSLDSEGTAPLRNAVARPITRGHGNASWSKGLLGCRNGAVRRLRHPNSLLRPGTAGSVRPLSVERAPRGRCLLVPAARVPRAAGQGALDLRGPRHRVLDDRRRLLDLQRGQRPQRALPLGRRLLLPAGVPGLLRVLAAAGPFNVPPPGRWPMAGRRDRRTRGGRRSGGPCSRHDHRGHIGQWTRDRDGPGLPDLRPDPGRAGDLRLRHLGLAPGPSVDVAGRGLRADCAR